MSFPQRCYGGVRLLEHGPSPMNVAKLDAGAIPMIQSMARTGLQVDLNHFAKMDVTLTQDMDRITEEARRVTGYYCNLSSGDQKSELLFKKLGLKQARAKMTRSGKRESIEDEVLTAIQHDHPVVPLMLEYAELEKLRGTYVRPMPKLARRTAFGVWRMYPNFRTTRVPSGRLSCNDPNLLAMPTRTERGRDIRRGFITQDGWIIFSEDESQIEPRIAAHRSKDENLIRIYQEEEDIYSDFATASFRLKDERYQDEAGKWHYPTVDKMQHRRPAKTCVLAALYCVTAGGLLEQMPVVCLNCGKEATLHDCGRFAPYWTENKCQDMLNDMLLHYSGIPWMWKQDHARVRKDGFITDMFGRILHVAAVRSVLEWVANGALREATNFPMQSSAQGTIKLSMAAIWDDLVGSKMLDVVHPLLQVHDELLYECREDVADELHEINKYRFENCVVLNVPIKTSYATAVNWGSLEK